MTRNRRSTRGRSARGGRPCDYTGLTYDKLRGDSGIQWPCNEDAPDGTERLYSDGRFWAHPNECENYGRDLITGAPKNAQEYTAFNPEGRAMLKGAPYLPAHERPDDDHPLHLITGRTIYHFHTRTKTGRAPELNAAAPEVWVEMCAHDASAAGVTEGDLAEITTPRGRVRAVVRLTDIRRGVVFIPFHYGYWDSPAGDGPAEDAAGRAANELTLTDWDPVSKQPIFKTAAARVTRVADSNAATTARNLADRGSSKEGAR